MSLVDEGIGSHFRYPRDIYREAQGWGGPDHLPRWPIGHKKDESQPRTRYSIHQGTTRTPAQELAERFHALVEQWLPTATVLSDTRAVAMSTPYQEMIALGPTAIPHILDALADGSTPYWLWALRMLAGEDKARGAQTVAEAREAWLAWGADAGLR